MYRSICRVVINDPNLLREQGSYDPQCAMLKGKVKQEKEKAGRACAFKSVEVRARANLLSCFHNSYRVPWTE